MEVGGGASRDFKLTLGLCFDSPPSLDAHGALRHGSGTFQLALSGEFDFGSPESDDLHS